MPIYEYRCEKCGEFEHTQRITDPPLQRCPNCKRKVRRLISNTSFQLKGSGWYVTDYARDKKAGGEASSTTGGSDGTGKSESGTSESGKSEGTKTESSKTESSKSEGSKADGGKPTRASA